MRPADAARGWAALLLTAAVSAVAAPARYAVEERALADGPAVVIAQGSRRVVAPKTEPDQEGAGQARVSPDGRTVGWVALTSNCCTSYPLPTVLVLYRDGRVLRRVAPEGPPIWAWAFGPERGEVVLQQAYPHGPEVFTFTRVRIADGRTLGVYRCDQDERAHAPRPAWSQVVDVPCPDFVPPAQDEPAPEPGR